MSKFRQNSPKREKKAKKEGWEKEAEQGRKTTTVYKTSFSEELNCMIYSCAKFFCLCFPLLHLWGDFNLSLFLLYGHLIHVSPKSVFNLCSFIHWRHYQTFQDSAQDLWLSSSWASPPQWVHPQCSALIRSTYLNPVLAYWPSLLWPTPFSCVRINTAKLLFGVRARFTSTSLLQPEGYFCVYHTQKLWPT